MKKLMIFLFLSVILQGQAENVVWPSDGIKPDYLLYFIALIIFGGYIIISFKKIRKINMYGSLSINAVEAKEQLAAAQGITDIVKLERGWIVGPKRRRFFVCFKDKLRNLLVMPGTEVYAVTIENGSLLYFCQETGCQLGIIWYKHFLLPPNWNFIPDRNPESFHQLKEIEE